MQGMEHWSDVVTDKSRAGPGDKPGCLGETSTLKETFKLDNSDMIEIGGSAAIDINYKRTWTARNATLGKRAFWYKA
jgi:hypothetical protein